MVSMPDEIKERNIFKLILIMRFSCGTLDVGRPIFGQTIGEYEIRQPYHRRKEVSVKKSNNTMTLSYWRSRNQEKGGISGGQMISGYRKSCVDARWFLLVRFVVLLLSKTTN
jgi:hypothetical protein